MVANTPKYKRVADLMVQQGMGVDALVEASGVEPRVVEAIAHQRYTPSPEQRQRVSEVLGADRESILWGHTACVDADIHQPI